MRVRVRESQRVKIDIFKDANISILVLVSLETRLAWLIIDAIKPANTWRKRIYCTGSANIFEERTLHAMQML